MLLTDDQEAIRDAVRAFARRSAAPPPSRPGELRLRSDFPVERIDRDVRVCQIYEGTSDVQKIIIQRAL